MIPYNFMNYCAIPPYMMNPIYYSSNVPITYYSTPYSHPIVPNCLPIDSTPTDNPSTIEVNV